MRSPQQVRRIAVSVVSVVAIWITLTFMFSSTSCVTQGTCLAGPNHASWAIVESQIQSQTPAENVTTTSQVTLADGTVHFSLQRKSISEGTLFLILTQDGSSYRQDEGKPVRTVADALALVGSSGLGPSDMSIALLTTSKKEFEAMKLTTRAIASSFTNIQVFLAKPDADDIGTYKNRKLDGIQHERRARIARWRNYLMRRALSDEKHILWFDADVVEMSSVHGRSAVQAMISHSDENPDAGILTTTCHKSGFTNWDRNAWRVPGTGRKTFADPTGLDGLPDELLTQHDGGAEFDRFWIGVAEADKAAIIPDLVKHRLELHHLLPHTTDNALLPLDSVGGTILYMRADLVRQGLVFPAYEIVGSSWAATGWVGVETEGVCYLARGMKGGGCYSLGGKHFIRHCDIG